MCCVSKVKKLTDAFVKRELTYALQKKNASHVSFKNSINSSSAPEFLPPKRSTVLHIICKLFTQYPNKQSSDFLPAPWSLHSSYLWFFSGNFNTKFPEMYKVWDWASVWLRGCVVFCEPITMKWDFYTKTYSLKWDFFLFQCHTAKPALVWVNGIIFKWSVWRTLFLVHNKSVFYILSSPPAATPEIIIIFIICLLLIIIIL